MRIIAGEYGSRTLHTLSAQDTRPTQDRIKEAMFSSLGTYFCEGKALDLFAGSGSVGLEAISRGMQQAYFCDNNRAAIKVIESNVETLQVQHQCTVMLGTYAHMLEKCKEEQFALIFIDPPYALSVYEECLAFIDAHNMLEDEGVVVLESAAKDTFDERYGGLIKYKEKKYGSTRLSYYRKES